MQTQELAGTAAADAAAEHEALRETVERFVRNELMPLEGTLLAREASGGELHLTAAEAAPLL